MISHVFIFVLLTHTLALYEGDSPVKLLNEETFQKLLNSKSMWMVEFFCTLASIQLPSADIAFKQRPNTKKLQLLQKGSSTSLLWT